MDKPSREAKREAATLIIGSYFKRLTFKRSHCSNIKLIWRCLPTWNLRFNVYLYSLNNRMAKTVERMMAAEQEKYAICFVRVD